MGPRKQDWPGKCKRTSVKLFLFVCWMQNCLWQIRLSVHFCNEACAGLYLFFPAISRV